MDEQRRKSFPSESQGFSKSALIRLSAVLTLTAAALGAEQAPPATDVEALTRAHAVLAEVARTYRTAPALTDTITIIRTRAAAMDSSRVTVALGATTDAQFTNDGYRFLSKGDDVFITRDGVAEKYFRAPRTGNIDETLTGIPGGFGRVPIPHFVLRHLPEGDDPVQAFNLRMPMELKVAGYRRTSVEGREIDEIAFSARSGDVVAQIDAQTHLIRNVKLRIVPPVAKSPSMVLDQRYEPRVLDQLPEPITFDKSGRHGVSRVDQLGRFEGESLAAAQLFTPEGMPLKIADLRGSVVVLYFLTSRCGSCLEAMTALDELANELGAQGDRTKLYAVLSNDGDSLEERRRIAAQLWRDKPHSFPIVIDSDDTIVSPLGLSRSRRIVVLRPDLTILKIAEDPGAGLVASLKDLIAAAQRLAAPPAADRSP